MTYVQNRKAGYSLTRRSNISQAEPSLKERGRRVRSVDHLSHGDSRWWTASAIKNQFQDQLRLGQVITGSGCNSLERFEKECAGKRRDLSMFYYSRGVYGPRIDLFHPPPRFPAPRVFTPFAAIHFSLCDTWPERKKPPCHISGL